MARKRRKIKDLVLRRLATPDKTTIAIDKNLNSWLEKYMSNINIPKYMDDGEISYRNYTKTDVILDLIVFFEIMSKTILNDEKIQEVAPYPFKRVTPFNMLRYFKKYGIIDMEEFNDVLFEIENVEGE